MTVLVRSQLPQDQIVRALHHALSQVVTTAPMAAMLAVTGLSGMASYSVSRRMKEQGIRIALGAQRFQVIRSTLARPIVILLSGCCIGLVWRITDRAHVLARLISFASTSDPLVLSGVILTMMLLGLIATWIPGPPVPAHRSRSALARVLNDHD